MFEMSWIDDLDGSAACDAVVAAHAGVLEHEARMLALAAHWADLHNGDAVDGTGRVLPGRERAKRLGAPGTPRIMEFATAEFAALQGVGFISADNLVRDALNLRHHHPVMWRAVFAGAARVWQAREVAKMAGVAGLSREQTHWLDTATTHRLASLPWGRFVKVVEAKIIEADPLAADARRKAAAAERFVHAGQCNEYGLKTIVAKAEAGDVIWFLATIDRIAMVLAANGDTDLVDVRRSKAIRILAKPAHALQLLQDHQDTLSTAITVPAGDPAPADGTSEGDGDPELVAEGDLHPGDNDADDPDLQRSACPTCHGQGTVAGDPAAFTRIRIDPKKLLPPVTLYLHLAQTSFTRDPHTGVARFEGVGPVTVTQAQEFLGEHCAVTITPVIDLAHQVPVDAYEVPTAMAEALRLRNPADVFPYASNLGRRKDKDHTIAYLHPDNGGPPGQTHLGNLGPLTRFHHRIRTHSRWRLKQPHPGVYLWRTPHNRHYLVDHNGTHALGNDPAACALWDADRPRLQLIPASTSLEYERAHHQAA